MSPGRPLRRLTRPSTGRVLDRRSFVLGALALAGTGCGSGNRARSGDRAAGIASGVSTASGAGVEHLFGEPIYSESVYADAVSDDGRSGFVVRICRYPTAGTSWLWGHAFTPEGLWAFTSHDAPCSPGRTDFLAAGATYRERGAGCELELERVGSLFAPGRCRVRASFSAWPDPEAVHGPGPVPISVEAELEPGHAPVSSLVGRTEVLGPVRARLRVDGVEREIEARGHFHEQYQERPRWIAPFVYATLRGDDWWSVAIKLEQGAVGFVVDEGEARAVESFAIEAPTATAANRAFRLGLDGGDAIEGVCLDRWVYSIPIHERRRRGSVVAGQVAGRAVSGCVNDWLPERLDYGA